MVFALAGCFFWDNWVVSYFHGQNKYKITGGRHLVDIIGDISWTKEVTSHGHFW